MGENSKIEWTDHTFNPWVGCAKVSAACTSCYAESWAKRTGQAGLWRGDRRRTSADNWRKPLKWNRETPGARVFCASLADVFEDRDDLIMWRWDLMRLIRETPNLTWLLLTKRPEHMARWFERVDTVPPNVWVGTTVEDQQRADERIPHLLRVPAAVRFLSCEPLLSAIDLRGYLMSGDLPAHCAACGAGHGFMRCPNYGNVAPTRTDPVTHEVVCERFVKSTGARHGLHWVITGGESGGRARPSHPDWFRSIRRQCAAAGVPFHFKQWGEWREGTWAENEGDVRAARVMTRDGRSGTSTTFDPVAGDALVVKVGKARAGRLLDGVTHDAFPEVARVG